MWYLKTPWINWGCGVRTFIIPVILSMNSARSPCLVTCVPSNAFLCTWSDFLYEFVFWPYFSEGPQRKAQDLQSGAKITWHQRQHVSCIRREKRCIFTFIYICKNTKVDTSYYEILLLSYWDLILSDNSHHSSFRKIRLTAGRQRSVRCCFSLPWVGVQIFQFNVLCLMLGFYSPCLKNVLEMFSFGSQTRHV
jgi:hypothetical protein